jgi:hypothetical protein
LPLDSARRLKRSFFDSSAINISHYRYITDIYPTYVRYIVFAWALQLIGSDVGCLREIDGGVDHGLFMLGLWMTWFVMPL